jgi:PIN domain nuclease of toxin-antitoxin system
MRHATTAGQPIYVSAITFVEVAYLIDKGKLPAADWLLLGSAVSNGVKTALELVPVDRAVAEAVALIPRAAIPDMPDRIIAATALHLGVPLISRDRKIQSSSIQTIW